MARDVINTRVELDRETDTAFRGLARAEQRSKRQMLAILASRAVRVWKSSPDLLRQAGLLKD